MGQVAARFAQQLLVSLDRLDDLDLFFLRSVVTVRISAIP
jgi:hypothetical protein